MEEQKTLIEKCIIAECDLDYKDALLFSVFQIVNKRLNYLLECLEKNRFDVYYANSLLCLSIYHLEYTIESFKIAEIEFEKARGELFQSLKHTPQAKA